MNGNGLPLHSDHLMRQPNELLDHMQWWARSIVKDHIQMVNAESGEVCRGVEFGIQTDNESDITLGEVREDVLKRAR